MRCLVDGLQPGVASCRFGVFYMSLASLHDRACTPCGAVVTFPLLPEQRVDSQASLSFRWCVCAGCVQRDSGPGAEEGGQG